MKVLLQQSLGPVLNRTPSQRKNPLIFSTVKQEKKYRWSMEKHDLHSFKQTRLKSMTQ